jgi:hypothetical protein
VERHRDGWARKEQQDGSDSLSTCHHGVTEKALGKQIAISSMAT